MITTMDSAGRLVIPKEIRRLAGFKAGLPLEVRYDDGRIEIEATTLPVRLERHGHLVVAVPEVDVEPLTLEMVDDTREAIRDEREAW